MPGPIYLFIIYFLILNIGPYFKILTDLVQILQEAQKRWLRPAEICEILRNYKKFQLAPDPPVQPPGYYFDVPQLFIPI